MNKTPLNFIREKGLLSEYRQWSYKPPPDRSEYMRQYYLKRKAKLFSTIS